MLEFWQNYLFRPLLNLLLYLYSGPAFGNMGFAIIELTVLLRIALLPLTLLDERNRSLYERLSRKMESLARDFKGDHVKRKEMIRELLKQHRVNYWAKVLVLGVQGLVLVLLYQVFMGGLKFDRPEALYSWVNRPEAVNTLFLGFDLAKHSTFWPLLVAVVLFLEIYSVQKKHVHLVTRSDVMYLIFFPLFTAVALLLLPMVKSLFILTSMVFSMLVFWIRQVVFGHKVSEDDD
ncbi:MAG: YidC/Oxa1 family membrane protein insertase [Patescibacteria group bacterium]|nr:YidC/Oxa1 family membrane protein insertase [Patescibacteria group bacterium]